jgi:hypothetical protein
MVTSKQLFAKYGSPEHERNMIVLAIPIGLNLDHIPHKIYCNADIAPHLLSAFQRISDLQLGHLIITWDGCFNIRRKTASSSQSLHSWGYAVDINAAWNRFGHPSTQDPRLVKCFKDAGFDWGGDWKAGSCDAMHFQLSSIKSNT